MKTGPQRVYLKDIAREANLSLSTVSMALKGNSSFRRETVSRVKRIAEEMGYVPDPVMSALASYRSQRSLKNVSKVIALVTNSPDGDKWFPSNHGKIIFSSAKNHAEKLGYKIEYFWIQENGCNPERLEEILKNRGIQSLIISPYGLMDECLNLDWDRYFTTVIGRPRMLRGIPYCANNKYEDVQYLYRVLGAAGYGRVGIVCDSSLRHLNHYLFDSGISSVSDHTINIPVLDLNLDLDHFTLMNQLRFWMNEHQVDGIISNSSDIYCYLDHPELNHIPFVSTDVTGHQSHVAGIDPKYDLLGKTAVDIVHSQFVNNKNGLSEQSIGHLIDGIWSPGSSCILNDEGSLQPMVVKQ